MEEEKKPENTEENKQPEVDLIDKEGHKEKLEVYEEKEEPIKQEEVIQPNIEEKREEVKEEPKEEKPVEEKKEEPKVEEPKQEPHEPKEPIKKRLLNFYDKKYKKLMLIPILMLVLAIIILGVQTARTGSFIHKDVSLKGGVTLTITKEGAIDIITLEKSLESQFTQNDISVRSIKKGSTQIGVVVVADIEGTKKEELDSFIDAIESSVGELKEEDYSIEVMGSSLGASFFKETIKAIYISFLFMGIVVFWYFGQNINLKIAGTILSITAASLMFFGNTSTTKDSIAYIIGVIIIIIYLKNSIPSFMVVFNVFSDIIVTLAIVNLMGIKLSTAGIAAFLMIIGYSVDTNILLSTKLLKGKKGEIIDRLMGAMKTGLTMGITTAAAVIVALLFSQSNVIKQIMTILLIGLIIDMIYTWLQNAGILRLYLEKKQKNE